MRCNPVIRIALVAHLSEISGAGVALLGTARGLDPARFRAAIVLPGNGPLGRRARGLGIGTVVVANPEKSLASSSLPRRVAIAFSRLVTAVRLAALFRRFDVIYVNSSVSIFPGLAAWLSHRRVVWHIHEVIENPGAAARLKMRVIERLADAVIYASAASEAAFPARRVRRRLIAKNYVGIAQYRDAVRDPRTEQSLGIEENERVVVTNGMFPRKGTDIFARAAAETARMLSSPARFIIIGAATSEHEAFRREVADFIDTCGMKDRIVFAGFRDDLPAILKRADAFVSASRNEAAPIAIIEAMAAGAPVVATDVGDCRAMLGDGRMGLIVAPRDAAALARAIADALENPGAARARAKLAAEWAAREYAPDQFWKPLENLLEDVARET
ncbi:MAG: glycosyltransferase family 4 protein [bacterium]|nr:glycosyltransferase family 4 protein [Candidatus Sumerlaeota bacterium]